MNSVNTKKIIITSNMKKLNISHGTKQSVAEQIATLLFSI